MAKTKTKMRQPRAKAILRLKTSHELTRRLGQSQVVVTAAGQEAGSCRPGSRDGGRCHFSEGIRDRNAPCAAGAAPDGGCLLEDVLLAPPPWPDFHPDLAPRWTMSRAQPEPFYEFAGMVLGL
jgi:hypothetical protein